MTTIDEAQYLIKYKLRQFGGLVMIHRFSEVEHGWEDFYFRRRSREATTLLNIEPESADHLPWRMALARGREDLFDQLMYLLIEQAGSPADYADLKVHETFWRMEEGFNSPNNRRILMAG